MTYQPLYRSRPAHRWTYGDLACRVGADLGLPPDDEQRWVLDTIYAEKAPGRPAAFEVATVAPRQNIKTSVFGIGALTDLFVFEVQRHLWTAHHGDTLKGTFQDFRGWIRSNSEYEDQVDFYEGHQDMGIVHRETGGRIEFQSRGGSGKFGRGLTGVERVTMDEALYLEAKHIGAVYPTMLTRPGAQVRIASSAGLVASEQLRRIRDRGREGRDKRLAYLEYGAERRECLRADCTHAVGYEGCALDDRELWWQANCAMWCGRVSEESLADQRNSMPPAEFMREFLSWWEDPELLGGAVPYATWLDLSDATADRGVDVVFGLDVAEDRTGWVAVAWRRPDGSAQVMLANSGEPVPAYRVVEECKRLTGEWGGLVIPPRAFEEELTGSGVPISELKPSDFPHACGTFADAVTSRTVRHGNQKALNESVKALRWRNAGADGARAWQLSGCPEAGAATAATRAMYGISQGLDYDVMDSIR